MDIEAHECELVWCSRFKVFFFSLLNDTSIPLWMQDHNKTSGLSRRKHAYLERTKNTVVLFLCFWHAACTVNTLPHLSLSSHTNFTHYYPVNKEIFKVIFKHSSIYKQIFISKYIWIYIHTPPETGLMVTGSLTLVLCSRSRNYKVLLKKRI